MAFDRALLEFVGAQRANTKSDNIKDGRGRLLVLKNVYGDMNDGATFVGEFKVLTSAAKGDMALQPFSPGKPQLQVDPPRQAECNQPGSIIGWPQKLKKHKSAAGNVKAYILALLGFQENEVTPSDFASAVQQLVNDDAKAGAVQPGRGMLIDFETYRQTTKTGPNAGQINTYIRYITVPRGNDANDVNSNHPAQIAARRAELDKSAPLAPQ